MSATASIERHSANADFTVPFTKFCFYLCSKYRGNIEQSNQIDKDDVYQAAMMAIVQARTTWDPKRMPWEKWAMSKAHNGVIDLLRKVNGRGGPNYPKRPHMVEYEDIKHDKADPSNDPDVIDDKLTDPFIVKRIEEMMCQLEPRAQAMVDLYYRKDWSLRELGEFFGVTESRCSQIVTKALHDMRIDPRSEGLRAMEWSPIRVQQFKALHNKEFYKTAVEQGCTVRQIADHLDMNKGTVREEMRRFRVEPVKDDKKSAGRISARLLG